MAMMTDARNPSTKALQYDLIKSETMEGDKERLLTHAAGTLKMEPKSKQVTPTKENNSAKSAPKRRSPKTPWKKPKDMPRRPLSAYNFFFQRERERLLQNPGKSVTERGSPVPEKVSSSVSESSDDQGKTRPHVKKSGIGFANLAKTIASEWKLLNPIARSEFEALAATEKERYNKEMVVWRNKKKLEKDISEQVRKIDAVIRTGTHLTQSFYSHPAFMRRLSDPFPVVSHHLEYHPSQEQQKRFSASHIMTPRLISLGEENNLEPIAITSFASNQITSQEPGLHSFQDEANELLRAFSDTFPPEHGYDVRSCEDIVADVSTSSDQKKLHDGSVTQSSLRALGSSLGRHTVDFLTQLKF
jgi:hypothetical protein